MTRKTKGERKGEGIQTVSKPYQNSTGALLTIGRMARLLGVDRKTLRKWSRRGLIPSFVNPISGYRMFVKNEVLTELKRLQSGGQSPIDLRKRKA